jgi:hypothetical protein
MDEFFDELPLVIDLIAVFQRIDKITPNPTSDIIITIIIHLDDGLWKKRSGSDTVDGHAWCAKSKVPGTLQYTIIGSPLVELRSRYALLRLTRPFAPPHLTREQFLKEIRGGSSTSARTAQFNFLGLE